MQMSIPDQPSRVCFPFVGDSVGGSQISAAQLIRSLDPDHFVPIVLIHQEGPLCDYFDRLNIKYTLLPLSDFVGSGSTVLNHFLAILSTLPKLWRYLKASRIDVVHTQDGRMNQTWALPGMLSGTVQIWHQRSVYGLSGLTRFCLTRSTAVICNSRFVKDSLPAIFQSKAQVVTNPFERNFATPDRTACRTRCQQATNAASDTQYVGFIGNLTTQKRPRIFVEVAKILNDQMPGKLKFLLFGRDRDGLMPEIKEQIKQNGLDDVVHFMGFQDNIHEWIAGLDVLLAPQVNEAFGRTLVEAMLVGTPTVASNSGGHPEVITTSEIGKLVKADGIEDMASAAMSYLAIPVETRSAAERERIEAAGKYSLSAHASEISGIYRQCLNQR
jgi:glycosyltransferase involved in cell wall biosynthesis